jgi:ABC-type nitrate/sulfonate/bicarbonate transport system permease component
LKTTSGDRTSETAAVAPAEPVRSQEWLSTTLTVIAVLALWQLIAATVLSGRHILPTPTSVLAQMWRDRGFYVPHVRTTVREAAQGYLWGNVAGIGVAVLFLALPTVENVFLRLAVASYCVPIIAIGPIVSVVYGGDTPKVILAAMSVFFTTLVGTLLGLRSPDRASLDLVRASGGSRWKALRKVQMPAALPSVFAALKIAAPAALLGAIIGEYLGGESGLGVAMIASEQALNVTRTWGLAFVTAVIGGSAYILTGVIARVVTPWAPRRESR